MEKQVLKITLFNEFTFEYQGTKYNLENILSKRLLNLLRMLILRYGESVSTESLINILWDDSDNPKSAVKFHVFKLRQILKDIPGFEDIKIIQTKKGGYEFKPDIECIIDVIVFQDNYLYIQETETLSKNDLQYAETIEQVYKGLLKMDSTNMRLFQIVEYYHDIYMKTVHKLFKYYSQNDMNEKLKSVALKAAIIDPSVEENHIFYIQSLISLKEYAQAFEYYQKSTKMLVEVYAISLSNRMEILYDFLVDEIEEKRSVEAIKVHFKNKVYDKGAFYCESSLFEYIYDMFLRSSERTDNRYYIFIFEIQPKIDIKKIIPKVKNVIKSSLRSGDVYTKINKFQFLALLPCNSDETAHMVAQRVTQNIRKTVGHDKANVYYSIDKVIEGGEERL